MDITEIKVRKCNKEGNLKAFVSITFDDELVVHDIRLVDGEKGLFIAMPSRKNNEGEYKDIVHPINSTMRNRIKDVVVKAYDDLILAEEAAATTEH